MTVEKKQTGSKKQITFLFIMLAIVILIIAGYVVKDRSTANKIITQGDTAPQFSLPGLDGRTVSLADLRGKVVMVHFWATWCPPCVEEIPTIAALNDKLKGTDFVLLAVSVDDGGAPAVSAFLRKHGLDLPVLLDPDRSTASRYGTYKFPETYILDRNGVVQLKVIGARDWADPAPLKFLQDLIAGKPS